MGLYTVFDDNNADYIIQNHLDYICLEILKEIPKLEAIILVGGFGKGEGSVLIHGDYIEPINDYDILIVTNKRPAERLKRLSINLARKIGIDFVDLSAISFKRLKKLPLNIMNYDTKYGSTVLFGDNKILAEIPEYNSKEIPMWEGVNLIFNRMAGILGGLNSNIFDRRCSADKERYLVNQLMKALIACGDLLILSRRKYHHLYSKRKLIFADLSNKIFEPEYTSIIETAYDFKLSPNYELVKDLYKFLYQSLNILKEFYFLIIESYLNKTHHYYSDSLQDLNNIAIENLNSQQLNCKMIIKNIRNYYRFHKKILFRLQFKDIIKFKHVILNTLPHLLFAISEEGFKKDYYIEAANRFQLMKRTNNWFHIKDSLLHLWELNCH